MTARARILRLAPIGLLPPACLLVHELRYVLAYGRGAGAYLQRTGHSYLHSLVPWLVLALAIGIGGFLRAVGRAMAGQRSLPRYAISLTGLWLLCSLALVLIFACQELLEGIFATGHPAGMMGIFGYGGWWAILAAVCVGLVLAAVFHGARWALEEVARRSVRTEPVGTRRPVAGARPVDILGPRLAPLATGWSGRGPPR